MNALLIEHHPDAGIHAPSQLSDNFVVMIRAYCIAKFYPKKTVALLCAESQWLLDELKINLCIAFCIDREVFV